MSVEGDLFWFSASPESIKRVLIKYLSYFYYLTKLIFIIQTKFIIRDGTSCILSNDLTRLPFVVWISCFPSSNLILTNNQMPLSFIVILIKLL